MVMCIFFQHKIYFSQHIWQSCFRLHTRNDSDKSTLYGGTKKSSHGMLKIQKNHVCCGNFFTPEIGAFFIGVFPFRLLPFCLLPFRLLPFRLLSKVKSVPFRLLFTGEGYSHFAYSRFAYSRFAYSRFAYSQKFISPEIPS